VFSFLRFSRDPDDFCVIVLNMTPVSYESFIIGVPRTGIYEEILNSDKDIYGGSNVFNGVPLVANPWAMHGYPQSIDMKLAPLSITVFQYKPQEPVTLFSQEPEPVKPTILAAKTPKEPGKSIK